MERLYLEIRDFFKTKYYLVAGAGYVISAVNIYFFYSLLMKNTPVFLSLIVIAISIFFINFIFVAITSLYIDLQIEGNNTIRPKELFYFYGISEYLTLFLVPVSYFHILGVLKSFTFVIIFILFSLIWILRIWYVKKYSKIGFINSIIAVFFPQMLLSVIWISFMVILIIFLVIKMYV